MLICDISASVDNTVNVNLRAGGVGLFLGVLLDFVGRRVFNPSDVCNISEWTTLFSNIGFQVVFIVTLVCVLTAGLIWYGVYVHYGKSQSK